MSENTEQEGRTRTLGLTRWVQSTFMVLALCLFWLLDKLITVGWGYFADPDSTTASAAAALGAGTAAWLAYRNVRVQAAANDIVGELAKVSWPTRKETTASAIVVIITSIIAAVIVGSFDTIWSAITDLIYKA
jgi:preprotein translocase subunit SecE